MMKGILYIVLIVCCTATYGQSINMDSIFDPPLRGETFLKKTGTEGRQFYNDDWVLGDIKLCSGETVFNKQLKYNVLLDEVIWLQAGTFRQVKLEKHFIIEFSLKEKQGRVIIFKKIRVKLPTMNDSADIFVEVLAEKATSLYVFRSVRVEETSNIVNGVQTYVGNIVPQPQYIVKLPDQQTITFKRIKKKVIINALPEKYRNTVKATTQQNHLSIRTEEDLTKLVTFIKD
jgi:hypothetical protein